MENQPGTSRSGSEHSADHKLALTEENLDYFLRQEYTFSKMCFDADEMTLEVLRKTENLPCLKNPNNFNELNTKQDRFEGVDSDNISDEKLVLGQDDSDSFCFRCPPMDQNNEDAKMRMKSLKELFNIDVDAAELIALFKFCQDEYGENAEYMWKEKFQEVWQTKKLMEEKLSAIAPIQEDVTMDTGKVSKEQICFKVNMNNSTSTDNSIPLNINYNINSKIQIENKLENLSCIKYFVDDGEMEIPREFPVSISINNETYQSLSSSVESSHLQEPVGLNKASEYITSTQNNVGLIMKKQTNNISSVRDLALASCSSHDIEFIDADQDCFESPTSEIPFYKTDSEDSKEIKTLSSNKTRGNILDLEDLLNTFTESTNLHIRNVNFEDVIPAKSSLKRKISQISNDKNKVKKSVVKFTSVTIFYFERSQGFSSIPTKGGSTLGMANQHFYISTIPIDEYEHRKVQKLQPHFRKTNIIYHRKCDTKEKPKNVQALTPSQRIELLESADVQIELKEEDDCAQIRSSRASAGCDCKEYCDPEICCCSLSGIECQVDRPNFPCGCSRENCRNVMGRNEYNHNKVKTHFTKTMRKIRLENNGRTSKRKQASPIRVINNNSDITRDINIIEI